MRSRPTSMQVFRRCHYLRYPLRCLPNRMFRLIRQTPYYPVYGRPPRYHRSPRRNRLRPSTLIPPPKNRTLTSPPKPTLVSMRKSPALLNHVYDRPHRHPQRSPCRSPTLTTIPNQMPKYTLKRTPKSTSSKTQSPILSPTIERPPDHSQMSRFPHYHVHSRPLCHDYSYL